MNRRQAIGTLAAIGLTRPPVYLPLIAAEAPPVLPMGTACRIVWVWPAGEALSGSQATDARTQLTAALAYWNARPALPGLFVAREEARRIDDPYASHRWLYELEASGLLTIAVVINPASRRLVDLGGGIAAPAYNWPGKRTCYASLASSGAYGHVGLGAQVAHELGHALYGLADGDPAEPIMGDYDGAWQRWTGRCHAIAMEKP